MRCKIRLSAEQIIAIGFALIIVCGALLLMLPFASRSGQSLGFFDALFTAASATCVTGLVVADTWTQFSAFGQAVLLLLIQLGGLGFISVATFVSILFGQKIGLRKRTLMMESVGSLQLGGIVLLMRHVVLGTVLFEGVGALLLALRFCPEMGPVGIWYGVFHAVSAFCNAGFDLMGRFEPYASLSLFRGDVYVNVVVMLLILTGGIGFVVWEDVLRHKLHVSRYTLHTKIMLAATAGLILLPAVYFFLTEREGAMAGLSVGQRILASLFQSVSARTAGFNTVPLDRLTPGGSLMMCLLMVVGAGAGSTAGGVKVTTFAIVFLYVLSYCRGRSFVQVFGRRLDEGQMRRAFTVTMFFLTMAVLGCLLILLLQSLPLRDVLFEVLSALGTVGLSTGITRLLLPASRMVIVLLMYLGRLGSITVVMAMADKKSAPKIQYPAEKIIIG